MNKKLSIAEIKSGILIDAPELITVEVVVKGKICDFDIYIKIMDYSTTIAQMEANRNNKEALASILADCIVNEKGEPEFTEDEIRAKFNKPLIEAIWAKILEKNFLGKVTPTTNSNKKKFGQNSSSTASVEKPLQKPKKPSVTESSSSGVSIEEPVEALTSD